jgi:hypothetical protein
MRTKLGILAIAVVAAIGSSLVAAPAQAGHKHKHKHGKKHVEYVHRSHGHAVPHAVRHGHGRIGVGFSTPRPFLVPRHIGPAARGTFRPYYHELVYFRPHRHHHAVYFFPVRTRFGWTWQPHSYCEGNLFRGRVAYDGPRVSFDVRF